MANSNGEPNPLAQQNIPPFSVREVYKAGWLKGVSFPGERRGVIFGKKYERLWALFCIHDDVQPFLEFYIEPKATPSHLPIWATSLAQCMHVSHSIAVQGDTFEFVVTCRECTVLRLGASTREQMNEWVDVLRNRLRDIGVLEPKENFYSPLPESAKPPPITNLSSTRDPNSPLPLPPASRNQLRSDQQHQQQQQDVLYADTVESQVTTVSADEPVESHVTVISVNEDISDDSTFHTNESSAVTGPPSMFSTRVRIASAPSSLREAIEVENSYEAIFNSSSTSSSTAAAAAVVVPLAAALPVTPTTTNHRSNRQLPELPSAHPPDHGVVVRTSSHHHHPLTTHHNMGSHGQQQRTREGLRRTMSVGQEHQHLHQMSRSIPPPPLLMQPGHGRGGREGGLVLLPRPPPLLIPPSAQPSTSSSLHHPLGTRHSSPLFRPSNHQSNGAALQPVNANHGPGAESGYSLKERQVARLRMEMQHPAGVRIILKKRDCLNTIALIDALGAVWYFHPICFSNSNVYFYFGNFPYRVAGWRQKEKPLLYNVFHIGDQIIRVSHCNISSSADVNRLIKNESSGQVND
jgi:hypothetical protein